MCTIFHLVTNFKHIELIALETKYFRLYSETTNNIVISDLSGDMNDEMMKPPTSPQKEKKKSSQKTCVFLGVDTTPRKTSFCKKEKQLISLGRSVLLLLWNLSSRNVSLYSTIQLMLT